jgi:hypothetical protein
MISLGRRYCTVSPGSGFSACSFSIAVMIRCQIAEGSEKPFSKCSSTRLTLVVSAAMVAAVTYCSPGADAMMVLVACMGGDE